MEVIGQFPIGMEILDQSFPLTDISWNNYG